MVDIRKHKSRGDTIVRHSGPFFIVQPGVSREIRRRCALALAQTGPSKYFNYSSVRLLADEITLCSRPLIDTDIHGYISEPIVAAPTIKSSRDSSRARKAS